MLRRLVFAAALLAGTVAPATAQYPTYGLPGGRPYYSPTPQSWSYQPVIPRPTQQGYYEPRVVPYPTNQPVYVSPYYKPSTGTYVQPHFRSLPSRW